MRYKLNLFIYLLYIFVPHLYLSMSIYTNTVTRTENGILRDGNLRP